MLGDVSHRAAAELRKEDVAMYFARLIQRTSPKSLPQALGEVTVTRKFLENFSGDQVTCATRGPSLCGIVVRQRVHMCTRLTTVIAPLLQLQCRLIVGVVVVRCRCASSRVPSALLEIVTGSRATVTGGWSGMWPP